MIKRLAVIGVGLIGGSLARALRRAGAVAEIVGAGRSLANLEQALALGIIDRYVLDAGAAAEGADMVVLGATLGATPSILAALTGRLDPATVVTDVGSTKMNVIAAARAALGDSFPQFVPAHPIAGTEHSGAAASFASLFERHKVILTPLAETSDHALARVRAMWEICGATVSEMSAERHDEVLAATSHLPHLLAFSLIDTLASEKNSESIFEFAAGGFRDFTRIASSNPQMWRDIALANAPMLRAVCARYLDHLGHLMQALDSGDGAYIEASFKRAKDARDRCVLPQSNERS